MVLSQKMKKIVNFYLRKFEINWILDQIHDSAFSMTPRLTLRVEGEKIR